MATTLSAEASAILRARPRPSARRGWTYHHWLALAGGPFLLWQAWNYVAWLAAGPRAVTAYRDHHVAAWGAARVFEAAIVVASLGIATFVVRGCLRERRLTFDAQIVLAGALLVWWDPITNFIQPLFLYSSEWTNLNTWCGQAPFVINPQCGALPEPIVFIPLVYSFGFLGCAVIVNGIMAALRRRRPDLPAAGLVAAGLVGGMTIYLVMDSVMMRLNLWKWAGYPDALSIFGKQSKIPLSTALAAMVFFGSLVSVRFFRDDRGRTVFERGLDHLPARRRALLSFAAFVGFTQVVFAVTITLTIVPGPYASPWPTYPAHTVNGLCDNGAFHGTAYGPCPGNPGYRAPLRRLVP